MDELLAIQLIKRDWAAFVRQTKLLGLGRPVRRGTRIDLLVRPEGANEAFVAVLFCDDYDGRAPRLDFADPKNRKNVGREFWPRMANAPITSVEYEGRTLAIICTPGTYGYHIHSSHDKEAHPRETWKLPAVASLLHRFLTKMGPYQGRGV